jgi:uncharacterized protein YeaO (DUF488 family)
MGRQGHLRHGKTTIKTGRWDDPRGADDGFRLLVTRYRPRALPKSDETWDAWWKELGPSVELHAAAYGKGQPAISFDEYRRRYLEEMREPTPTQKIAWLARSIARGEPLMLLCSSACTDENRCHRSLLRELLLEEVGKLVP